MIIYYLASDDQCDSHLNTLKLMVIKAGWPDEFEVFHSPVQHSSLEPCLRCRTVTLPWGNVCSCPLWEKKRMYTGWMEFPHDGSPMLPVGNSSDTGGTGSKRQRYRKGGACVTHAYMWKLTNTEKADCSQHIVLYLWHVLVQDLSAHWSMQVSHTHHCMHDLK